MKKPSYQEQYQEFINRLRAERKRKGLSQTELSKLLGHHQTYVSKYERGDRKVDFIEFMNICRALEISPVEVVSVYTATLEAIEQIRKDRSKPSLK